MTTQEALELIKRAALDSAELHRTIKANHQLATEEAVGQLAALRQIESPESLVELAARIGELVPATAAAAPGDAAENPTL